MQTPNSPEGVLTKFVKERFNGTSVEDLKDLLSEKYLANIEELRGGEYEVLKEYKRKKFKIISKNCVEGSCKVTYFISYIKEKDNKGESETETKKVATLIKSDDQWLIDEIDHIKTYHDMINKLEVESK